MAVPRKQSRRLLSACLIGASSSLPILAIGCDQTGSPVSKVQVSDSAGIRIVSISEDPWSRAAEVPTAIRVTIGAEDTLEHPPLFSVSGVLLDSNGGLVIANAGTSQLLWFDATGRFLHSVGREGDGPGEFGSILRISHCAAGRIAVVERDRVTVVDAEGSLDTTTPIVPGTNEGGLWVYPPIAGCSKVVLGATVAEPPPAAGQLQPLRKTLFWEDRTGGRDTLVSQFTWTHQTGGTLQGRPVALIQPWGATSVWEVSRDRVIFGDGLTPQLSWITPDGTVASIIRWQAESRRVTGADRTQYDEARQRYLSGKPSYLAEIFVDLSLTVVPESMPYYDRLLVDDRGGVWVRQYPHHSAGRPDVPEWRVGEVLEDWAVFDEAGSAPRRVTLPPGHRLLSAGRGSVVTSSLDSLDRELVHVLSLPD